MFIEWGQGKQRMETIRNEHIWEQEKEIHNTSKDITLSQQLKWSAPSCAFVKRISSVKVY